MSRTGIKVTVGIAGLSGQPHVQLEARKDAALHRNHLQQDRAG